MPEQSFSKEIFPNIQSKSPLTQPEAKWEGEERQRALVSPCCCDIEEKALNIPKRQEITTHTNLYLLSAFQRRLQPHSPHSPWHSWHLGTHSSGPVPNLLLAQHVRPEEAPTWKDAIPNSHYFHHFLTHRSSAAWERSAAGFELLICRA